MTGPQVVPPIAELPMLATGLNGGERRTLESLLDLDEGWRVFIQPRLALAQPDFVAVHPDHGIWLLEVKDWSPDSYRSDARRWHRWVEVRTADGWARRASPLRQLQGYLRTFRDRFLDDGADEASVQGLLVLPRFTAEQAQDLLPGAPVLCGDELADIAGRLSSSTSASLEEETMRRLLRWLDEPENVRDERRPLILSAGARDVASNPSGAALRRVRGPAGSGKSLGLAARAVALAAQGKDVLLVTFNVTLAHYLHDLCARSARQNGVRHWQRVVSFTHLHGMLSELVDQLGETPDGDLSWERWAVATLHDAYARGTEDLPTFDAILVDEGQDFELAWWDLLRGRMLRDGGEMVLAVDRTQNLYGRSDWAAEGAAGGGFRGKWNELAGTYRMPVDLIPIVAEYARVHLPGRDLDLPTVEADHPALAEAHEPTVKCWVDVRDPNQLTTDAVDAVEQLIENHPDLSPSDVVLLADHDAGFAIIEELRARGRDAFCIFAPAGGAARKRLKRAFWAGRPGIKGCTVHSFKGWESRAVVCVPSPKGELALYIAMTRVKGEPSRPAFLTVVNPLEELRGFKPDFEREVLPSEVPALAGQRALDL